MGVVEGAMWVPPLGRWVPWEKSFFRETVGTRVFGVGGSSDYCWMKGLTPV